ncbi:DUF4880 domain-containing protein [Xylophilus sp.]|uniref:DUF4880 domain-containing protein n=1 Tax=Xylophilus sp. TaxID=2653893 RepID=UPI0013B5E610|nr:DUF4880 domain-containing protein [Xylophilus sp.]KAF1049153.1 MAG: Protein FecR [Xylophilus sp.]
MSSPERPPPGAAGAGEEERRALREAAAWHTRLRGEAAAPEAHAGWQRWHAASAAHRRAWQKVQTVEARLARLPAGLPGLDAPGRPPARR